MPILTVLFTAAVLAAPADGDASRGLSLERQALESRQKLVSGHVEFSVERKGTSRDGVWRFAIWFDGERIRVNRTDEYGHFEQRIFTGKEYFVDQRWQEGEPVRVTENGEGLYAWATDGVFHPNILGVYPISVAGFHHGQVSLDQILGRVVRRGEEVRDAELDGHAVEQISYENAYGSRMALWIAPGVDFTIIRTQASGKQDRTSTSSVQSEYAKFGGDVWYPKRAVFQHAQGGGVRTEEVFTVELAEFNGRVDPSLFTLGSLGLKQGEIVNRDGVSLLWDGEGLIEAESAKADPAVASQSPPAVGVRNWIWAAVAVGLALSACLILTRGRKRPVT